MASFRAGEQAHSKPRLASVPGVSLLSTRAVSCDHRTVATRREQHDSRTYKLVRLDLDDVEEIEQTLAAIDAPADRAPSFEYSNGTWKTDTLQGLVDVGTGPFTEFEMRRHGPGLLAVEVRNMDTRLYVSDLNDLQLRGAFDRIDTILRRARLPWAVRAINSAIGATLVFLGPAMFALVTLIAALAQSAGPRSWAIPLSVALLLYGIGGYALATQTALRRNGLVTLVRRDNQPNFFARNRDELWILVIGVVIGAVASWVTAVLTG